MRTLPITTPCEITQLCTVLGEFYVLCSVKASVTSKSAAIYFLFCFFDISLYVDCYYYSLFCFFDIFLYVNCYYQFKIILSHSSENLGRFLSHSSYSVNVWINGIFLLECTLFGKRKKKHLNSIF